MIMWVFEGVGYATHGGMLEARRRRYVELLDAGMNFTQAARAVGVTKRTGKAWRHGVTRPDGRNEKPKVDWYRSTMDKPKKIHPRYLGQDERLSIADWKRAGVPVREIARRLGREASTVSREIGRNTNPATGMYEPYRAQQMSADRLKRPKTAKVHRVPGLLDYIREGLRARWSPEQIAGRLRADFPDNGDMHVCAETIHQAIYVQAKGELRRDLDGALRSGRAARRPRGGADARKPRFREPMVMISERPAEAEDRAVPGHWEGDLILGAGNRSAIGTLVERSTRFTILLHLPDGHDAEHVQQAIIDRMRDLPDLLRASLTWDRGSELALHKRISAMLDMRVYFCDPHSPWQRGTNENTNGLLRQYFPKGADLNAYDGDHLDAVAAELNDRPRKTLGFMKPSEKILELLNAA
ncbi:MAG: IS30 family transposase [Bifidobacterium scardovii]|uniref:IS30 family transposase n=1 Tax=Bifidobacterium scardovii TaxID=158787 RepID=UPI0039967F90